MTFFDCHAPGWLAMTCKASPLGRGNQKKYIRFVYKMLNILKLGVIENINLLIILLTLN